jgi:hypothetical protein
MCPTTPSGDIPVVPVGRRCHGIALLAPPNPDRGGRRPPSGTDHERCIRIAPDLTPSREPRIRRCPVTGHDRVVATGDRHDKARRGMWSARAITTQVGVAAAGPVLRERRRHAGEATARAALLRLREGCLGPGHPVGQLTVEGRRCRLRRQPRDVLPLGARGVDPNRSRCTGVVQAGDEALQCSDIELVGPCPARRQLDVQPPRRSFGAEWVEGGDEEVGVGGALLAVDVRASVGQLTVTGTVGRRGAAARPNTVDLSG